MFEEQTLLANTNGACALAVADFNLDGTQDIVYTCYQSHHIQWLENDGELNFTSHMITEGFTNAKAIDVGDIDQDGYPDFVATAYGAGIIAWFHNDQNGNFTRYDLAGDWVNPGYVQVKDHLNDILVDMNSDGEVDILATACLSGRLGWFENDGAENFTEHIIRDGWTRVSGVSAIDIDGDGDMDIMAAAQAGGICWLENTGDPENFPEHVLFTEWDKPNWIMAGNINSDQYIDFVATSCGNSDAVGWFENNGSQEFTLHLLKDNYNGARCPVLSDIDEDGDMDIFSIAWQGAEVSFFENDGEENFTEQVISTSAYDLLKLFITDLDGDNDLDIAACAAVAGNPDLRWFESLDNFLLCDFSASVTNGHAPLNVEFIPAVYSKPEVFSYSWDFNNDGVIDSSDPAPVFQYLQSDYYDVNLSVTNGYTLESVTKEEYIRVFDGESALRFTAGNNHVQIPAIPEINFVNTFSIEAWICPDDYGYNPTTGMGRILDKDKISIFLCNNYPLYNSHSLVVKMVHAGGSISAVTTPENSINLTEGRHIAVTYDGEGELKIYLNGIEQQLTVQSAPAGVLEDNADIDCLIGNHLSLNAAFTGIIDEVRLWNVVRSQQEILENMTHYVTGTEAGLAGYWSFNEGCGEQVYDFSVNQNTGEMINCIWEQGTPFDLGTDTEENYIWDHEPEIRVFPNPFNPETRITFSLADGEEVQAGIYNMRGQLVRMLLAEFLDSGEHSVIWNGRDFSGKAVSSGIYYLRLQKGRQQFLKKIMLIK
ncbi:MAG: FG-GAP-like repeat-containing protein [Candidatus Cloacimonetes bacterium]|nr:FG-GAP-like repeat-containing protein [Candidatus Cloacimonadota bacterium]